MSLTLGEKLQAAREERGITISEVAEQTRISSLYLESIENDDYKGLPGGIFNKGFVKSFAKYVGVDEQEALVDYGRIVAANEEMGDPELKLYKPEVLTDDRSGSSMIPTVIVAVVILALMTGGILWLISYFRQPSNSPVANKTANSNTNAASDTSSNTNPNTPTGPEMSSLKVELTGDQLVKVVVTTDGVKSTSNISASSPATFTPKDSLTLDFLQWNASHLKLTINGKPIELPGEQLDPKDKNRIVFTISKENLAEIWTSGKISKTVPSIQTDANADNTASPATTGPATTAQPQAKPTVRPAVVANTAANTAVKPSTTPKTVTVPSAPPTMTSKPKTPANNQE